ncbi:Transcription termination factor mterf15 protein [Thalictrum thalictroides]|uniref:Transcription termination factor mterf15 protein n=1 Tax=Thalictrum thalictroides TaxID=46969 RepID=A0A7J6X6U2_THATH|nr:Transcription termination factor mterf15 protein [Thalictrum thalictroides]
MILREAFKVVYKKPRVILYDLEDIEKKIEFLKLKMGFSIDCLVEVPEYLGVNFDKQIVLRYNVLEYLRSKGGLGCEVGLKGMIKPREGEREDDGMIKVWKLCQGKSDRIGAGKRDRENWRSPDPRWRDEQILALRSKKFQNSLQTGWWRLRLRSQFGLTSCYLLLP